MTTKHVFGQSTWKTKNHRVYVQSRNLCLMCMIMFLKIISEMSVRSYYFLEQCWFKQHATTAMKREGYRGRSTSLAQEETRLPRTPPLSINISHFLSVSSLFFCLCPPDQVEDRKRRGREKVKLQGPGKKAQLFHLWWSGSITFQSYTYIHSFCSSSQNPG